MTEVIFIRHGATAGNLERRYIGRTDEPLCPEGISQLAGAKAANLSPQRVFVSPMLRARQTAQLLFPGAACEILPQLRETDFGVFEGRNAKEMEEDPAYRAWVDGMCLGPIPGGERVGAFKERCCRAFQELGAQLRDGERVAVVTHGGVIMAILEGLALPERDFYAYHIGNGQWLRTQWDGRSLTVEQD